MRQGKILPTALAAVLLTLSFTTATASANYRVGISEQNSALFAQPAWQALKLKRVRYVVPWDFYRYDYQLNDTATYMNAAHAAGQEVLVAFTAKRGCYANGKYLKSSSCRAPSTTAFHSAFLKFKHLYPWVKTYTPWNEENHVSQPTSSSPHRAAEYYDVVRKACGSTCTVMAADVLDQSNVTSWLRSFLHYSHGRGSIWGLHNYKDVNRHESKGLTNVLKVVPGDVWLTEVGGIVTFLPSFKTSESRASSATKYMFELADRFDSKRKGYKSKVTRLYDYSWFGQPGATFDSGLVNADDSPRPSYTQFAKYAKHRLK
jgi:hypothetical protein